MLVNCGNVMTLAWPRTTVGRRRELIAERAAVGRQAARSRGRLGGRPAKLSPEQARLARARYEARDVTVAEIARALGAGRGTIYRALRQAP
jgi:DNA invertase Pin-like site-specific DNA recombinase